MTQSTTTQGTTFPTDEHRRWAVVEIRRDGTLGSPEVIATHSATEAARLIRSTQRDKPHVSTELDARWGLAQAAHGHLNEAAQTLAHGMDHGDVEHCAGQLALVEAFRGDLGRAQRHASLALSVDRNPTGEGEHHAHLAQAWIQLERTEHDECEHTLRLVGAPVDARQESWYATARHLLEARLLIATHRPDAASRLLATTTENPADGRSGWARAVLAVAHAEALLAAGESRLALAALTPMSGEAEAESAVATATGRQAIGDGRGAKSVLHSVTAALEHAPLGLQIRAWILEARIAGEHDQHKRCWSLVERALRTAATDDLRAPLLWDWSWLRTYVEREPVLRHLHRSFLLGFRDLHAADRALTGPPTQIRDLPGIPFSAPLTEREAQVLELLAQMYSTEEIAGALYVSSNTVKTHVKGIFAKLCVNRRVDAVRRGQQLGLL